MLGALGPPAEMHERAHEQEHGQHGHNRIRERSRFAIVVDQGRLHVAESVILPIATQRHGEFVVMPAETGVVEVDDVQALIANDKVVGWQLPTLRVPALLAQSPV